MVTEDSGMALLRHVLLSLLVVYMLMCMCKRERERENTEREYRERIQRENTEREYRGRKSGTHVGDD